MRALTAFAHSAPQEVFFPRTRSPGKMISIYFASARAKLCRGLFGHCAFCACGWGLLFYYLAAYYLPETGGFFASTTRAWSCRNPLGYEEHGVDSPIKQGNI